MPYRISKRKDKFFVVNKETGKKYSKKPFPDKSSAMRQMRALYANADDNSRLHSLLKKDLIKIIDHFDLPIKKSLKKSDIIREIQKHKSDKEIDGAGLFDSIKKIAQIGKQAVGSLVQNVKGRFSGIRNDYPPKVRTWFGNNGSKMIRSITIYRTPVKSAILTALNVISLGTFKDKLKKLGFDQMFHLYMKLGFGGDEEALVEKNEVINIRPWKSSDEVQTPQDKTINVSNIPPGLTIDQFFKKGQALLGEKYFVYDPFTSNCQIYLKSLLQANNLLTPELNTFIFQDVQSLAKDLPFTEKIARGVTDFAARINTLVEGKGLKKIKKSIKGGMMSSNIKPSTKKDPVPKSSKESMGRERIMLDLYKDFIIPWQEVGNILNTLRILNITSYPIAYQLVIDMGIPLNPNAPPYV